MLDTLKEVWDDTRSFLGRHHNAAFATILALAWLAFGWEVILCSIAVGAAFAFVMYQMPDDHDDFRGA